MGAIKAAFLSVVPSPYQRDLFAALARRPEIDLKVFYLEHASPDSPWPKRPLAPYESVLPGDWFSLGSARCHVNWSLPRLGDFHVVVLNTIMSLTAQWALRAKLRSTPWMFWGERLRPRGAGWRQMFHDVLTEPLHRAKGIAGIGRLAVDDYRRRFPKPLHFNIPYFCALQPFLEAPRRTPEAETVFLFCGQMIARKGLDLVLAAFARLVEKNRKVRLRLVGREAELPLELAKLPAAARERISYEGFQPPEELPRYFTKADVFVLPSRHDGWGVVVNQALGAGLPLICSDAVGAAHDLITDGVNGCTFKGGDVDALLAAMERLAADPELRDHWGAASREAAQEWLPEKGAEKWAKAFETVQTIR
ncbi:MAG TPA: glycosyltransferase family 4 protein [Chthoniobacteraceae bacterium]